MFVWVNSIYTLATAATYVVCDLDIKYGVDSPGPLVKLFNSQNEFKFLAWGIFEQTSGYVLFYILPILLAIKLRTERNFATMAGTVIGTITVLTHLVNMATLAVFA